MADIVGITEHKKLLSINKKKQFRWSGDSDQLKEFLLSYLEEGNNDKFVSISRNGATRVLKFESVTVNFYTSTNTLQIQGAGKDGYISKLTDLVNTNSGNNENAETETDQAEAGEEISQSSKKQDEEKGEKAMHDARYEEFEAFMATQREFNTKIESQVSKNTIEIGEQSIDLEDWKQKIKNGLSDVKMHCESQIDSLKFEISESIKDVAKQVSNLSNKVTSEFKSVKNKSASTAETILKILGDLGEKTKTTTNVLWFTPG
ncbi:uncharacterized protein LOC125568223 [Nematostella vectensis]|uniref:uncharacterized protein LOC125568223 n=1 Tax=Nematostella vectensis TaxID=45351 RepID=UPI0020777D1B|nr:uncharacterized protein LOC125568223 [Nematostella vectensis]